MDMRAAYRALVAQHGGDAALAKAALDRLLEARRAEAGQKEIVAVATRLGLMPTLRRSSREYVGPCPVCGGHDRKDSDRFAIDPVKQVFLCRKCTEAQRKAHGGPVALVRHVLGCDYGAAVDWLLGEIDLGLTPEEIARREALAEADRKRRAREAETFRARAIRAARRTWEAAKPATGTPAQAYLAGRGIVLDVMPPTLRYLPEHPYIKQVGGQPVAMHKGPAMIAAVQDAAGKVMAVHQTWIDPDRPGQKAKITFEGEPQAAKLVRGSKKGGAIRLSSSRGCDTLVMGEGIETTLSALVADVFPRAAYWAGVDLGNMAGLMRPATREERRAGTRHSGQPDMSDDDAFVPPAWVRRLVFIQDGDSAPDATRAKLEAGLRRAMAKRPGLVAQIVHAGPGKDLNDVLREEG